MRTQSCCPLRCMVRLFGLRRERPDALQFLLFHFPVPAGRPGWAISRSAAAAIWPRWSGWRWPRWSFMPFGGWQFVPLLLASIAFNYGVGYLLIARKLRPGARFAVLTTGVAGDLAGARHLQICGFFAANLNALFSTGLVVNIVLPIGISFYTFTQIAFLVDAYRGHVARYALPHYALFVTYFPHLIAGPILHHKDMIPQFERAEQTPRSASDPVRPDHLRDRPVQEDVPGRRHPAAGRARRSAPLRRPSIRPGSARWPTRSSSISISPAIPTWRSACR